MIDLTPTTQRTSAVAAAVLDDQLDAQTPMGEPVRVVLHHVLGLATAFRDAARKETGSTVSTPPGPERGPLPEGWRSEIDQRLSELAEAWQSADAWDGMTMAGGVPLPGEVGGVIALNEVLLHGWDLARATGQPYQPSESECEAVLPIVTPESSDPQGAGRDGLFGPVVDVPEDAAPFDRVLGLAGRDPGWSDA